ncbi:hypothetical protein pb186bvf_019878 [Paramecium bursaria]
MIPIILYLHLNYLLSCNLSSRNLNKSDKMGRTINLTNPYSDLAKIRDPSQRVGITFQFKLLLKFLINPIRPNF